MLIVAGDADIRGAVVIDTQTSDTGATTPNLKVPLHKSPVVLINICALNSGCVIAEPINKNISLNYIYSE
jgi:hypothetical protein